MKFKTLLPACSEPEEVSVDHWFRADGKRYAVVYRLHHGEPIFHVREEKFLLPCDEHEEEAA